MSEGRLPTEENQYEQTTYPPPSLSFRSVFRGETDEPSETVECHGVRFGVHLFDRVARPPFFRDDLQRSGHSPPRGSADLRFGDVSRPREPADVRPPYQLLQHVQ